MLCVGMVLLKIILSCGLAVCSMEVLNIKIFKVLFFGLFSFVCVNWSMFLFPTEKKKSNKSVIPERSSQSQQNEECQH